MTEEQRQYNKEYYIKHKEERSKYAKEYYSKHKKEIKEKKQKSMTYYVLRTPGKEDLKFKKHKDAQLYSFIHHDDFPTYSIYRINVVTTEELVESSEDNENDIMNNKEAK